MPLHQTVKGYAGLLTVRGWFGREACGGPLASQVDDTSWTLQKALDWRCAVTQHVAAVPYIV